MKWLLTLWLVYTVFGGYLLIRNRPIKVSGPYVVETAFLDSVGHLESSVPCEGNLMDGAYGPVTKRTSWSDGFVEFESDVDWLDGYTSGRPVHPWVK